MNIRTLGIVLAVLAVVLYFSTYTVGEREKVILFSLGEIKDIEPAPGLHFKYPLVNNVRKFDARVMTLDAQPERFLTIEKKNVKVDFVVRWRIEDVGRYYRSTRGEAANAQSRLSQIVKDRLRDAFGQRTIQEAVSGERGEIMEIVRRDTDAVTDELGIHVLDVRISQIDLPDEVSDSVYDRMRAERERVAREFRARGKESAERIRAAADRNREIILAEAYREAEQIRGQGDAEATEIYAKAYGRNPEFYSFYRSLNAYTNSFTGENDMLVLEPDSAFFRYFVQPNPDESGAEGEDGGREASFSSE